MFLIQFQWRRRSPNLDINVQDYLTLPQKIEIGHLGHRCVATARQNIMLYNVIKQIYFKLPRIGKSKVRLTFDNCQVLSLHSPWIIPAWYRWVSLKLVGDCRAGPFGRSNHFRSALFFRISISNWLQLQLYWKGARRRLIHLQTN